jgi:hypothetical protein
MRQYRLASGLLLLAMTAGRANDKAVPGSLVDDLANLRGAWKMAVAPSDRQLYLEFGKASNLEIVHAVLGPDGRVTPRHAFTSFELTERGPKRSITPRKRGALSGDLLYRFQGDDLVIEDGESAIRDVNAQRDYKVSLKGEWKRIGPELEKLRGSWRPAEAIRGKEIHLKFQNDILEIVCRFPNELGMGPVEQQWMLVVLTADGNKRVIATASPRPGLSRVMYRMEGDTLLIDEGEYTVDGRTISLKGKWKGDRSDRVP